MNPANHGRRRLIKLGLVAAPAFALNAWPGNAAHEVWHPDSSLRFYSARDGIRWATRSHDGGLLLPLGLAYALTPGSLAPDGAHLAYSALDRRTGSSIWVAAIHFRSGQPIAGAPVAFCHGASFDVLPRFTRDGREIAYAARESGVWRARSRAFNA